MSLRKENNGGLIGQPQQQQQVNIDVSQLDTLECENPECDGIAFESTMIVKRVPKIMTGESQDRMITIPARRCVECKHYQIEELSSAKDIYDRLDKFNASRT